jgi:hypothetical protein
MERKKGPIRVLNERLTGIRQTPPWIAALVVLSSAALGGIAVALWNRKALATFRELDHEERPGETPDEQSSAPEDSFY